MADLKKINVLESSIKGFKADVNALPKLKKELLKNMIDKTQFNLYVNNVFYKIQQLDKMFKELGTSIEEAPETKEDLYYQAEYLKLQKEFQNIIKKVEKILGSKIKKEKDLTPLPGYA
ncbi:MAG: hypothetical protein QXQ79_00755 [Candidatus Nanoarchaeia archaeon]